MRSTKDLGEGSAVVAPHHHQPEFVHLRQPSGPTPPGGDTSPEALDSLTSEGTFRLPAQVQTTRPPRPPRQLRTLVQVWVEALNGRRPVDSLRRGPFSPEVIEHLRTRVRNRDAWGGRGVASELLSLHLVPCEAGKVRFTATISAGDRVRALTGCLEKHRAAAAGTELRWRIDSLVLI